MTKHLNKPIDLPLLSPLKQKEIVDLIDKRLTTQSFTPVEPELYLPLLSVEIDKYSDETYNGVSAYKIHYKHFSFVYLLTHDERSNQYSAEIQGEFLDDTDDVNGDAKSVRNEGMTAVMSIPTLPLGHDLAKYLHYDHIPHDLLEQFTFLQKYMRANLLISLLEKLPPNQFFLGISYAEISLLANGFPMSKDHLV